MEGGTFQEGWRVERDPIKALFQVSDWVQVRAAKGGKCPLRIISLNNITEDYRA